MKSSKKTLTLKKETLASISPFGLIIKGGKFPTLEAHTKGCPKSYPQNCCDNV